MTLPKPEPEDPESVNDRIRRRVAPGRRRDDRLVRRIFPTIPEEPPTSGVPPASPDEQGERPRSDAERMLDAMRRRRGGE